MKDLYSRHPDPAKSFLYKYRGRKDDVIVLSNGEKIAPALMEATLMSHPLVKSAMLVGKGKFQPAVIIDLVREPSKNPEERYRMVKKLLPIIAEANVHAPAHGILDEYHILFADPKKPMAYLGQGKFQRHETNKPYEDDIEQLYKSAEDATQNPGSSSTSGQPPPDVNFRMETSIAHWLEQLVADVAGTTTTQMKLNINEDLFQQAGLDSLHVVRIARELRIQAQRANLGKNIADKFQPNAIYKYPTLDQLKAFILHQAEGVGLFVDRHHSSASMDVKASNGSNDDYVTNLSRNSAVLTTVR